MQDLINEIADKAGITAEQATTALNVVQSYTNVPGTSSNADATEQPAAEAGKEEGIIDQLKEKAGGLLRNLEGNEMVHKAEEMLAGAKDKIAGFFK